MDSHYSEVFQIPAAVSGTGAECRRCGTNGEFKRVSAGAVGDMKYDGCTGASEAELVEVVSRNIV